jgi:hypothetical protein
VCEPSRVNSFRCFGGRSRDEFTTTTTARQSGGKTPDKRKDQPKEQDGERTSGRVHYSFIAARETIEFWNSMSPNYNDKPKIADERACGGGRRQTPASRPA